MNPNMLSPILAKASNCFYATLNNQLLVQTSNNSFKDLFREKQPIASTAFPNLFTLPFQQQWKEIFENKSSNDKTVYKLTNSVETVTGDICIDWNTCILQNAEHEPAGFEILGVPAQKPFYNTINPRHVDVSPYDLPGDAEEDTLAQANIQLEKKINELTESNAELEKFACIASHDLQEPLRMVTRFLQLLERKYKGKLDQQATDYITFAIDGAERMRRFILDLLEYSSINAAIIKKEDVDVNEAIADLRLTYKNVLKETNGTIFNGQLPLVKGNKTQIFQLFQNLISNAFKYRSEKPPVIDITYEEEPNYYNFAVTDNGSGIEPKFFEKIFIIFQRLHTREQYPGSGVGLAICKKIVDKHGGKIWVTSQPGNGSTFHFTLPKFE